MNTLPPLSELRPKKEFHAPRAPEGMKCFTLYRQVDETGISGAGKVVQGVVFANGKAVIQWLSGPDPGDTQVKDSWERFLDTHVKSHPINCTVITWDDGTQQTYEPQEQLEEAAI